MPLPAPAKTGPFHYILDASALVPCFYQETPWDRAARTVLMRLLKLSAEREAVLHVPDFCMAECSKAFARNAFSRHRHFEDARDECRQKVDALLDVVSSSRQGLVRRMALARVHLVDIEDVFLSEYSLRPRSKDRLSGADALLISMARAHEAELGRDRVAIVTADAWLATVCQRNRPQHPSAIDIRSGGV